MLIVLLIWQLVFLWFALLCSRVMAISVARVSIGLPSGVLVCALQKLYKHVNKLKHHSFHFLLSGSSSGKMIFTTSLGIGDRCPVADISYSAPRRKTEKRKNCPTTRRFEEMNDTSNWENQTEFMVEAETSILKKDQN